MSPIRLAKIEDAPAIARVHVDTWRTTYSGLIAEEHLARLSYERGQTQWVENLTDQKEKRTFVAESQPGQIVGFAACGPIREKIEDLDGELYAIYVLKAFQGMGLGRLLVRQVAGYLAGAGFHSIIIWVLKENPARGFYERLGGRVIAEKEIVIGGQSLKEVAYAWYDLGIIME